MKRFKRADIVFLAIIFLAALLIFIIPNFLITSPADYIEVNDDGEITRYEIDGNTNEIRIEKDGNLNIIVIDPDGTTYMKEANCPDKTCMRQGRIFKNNETIVCLPHRLIVRAKSAEESMDITVR